MIRAVIFDCFGVLMTEGWLPFAKQYFGNDTEVRQQATDLMSAVNKGLLDYENFIKRVAELAQVDEAFAHTSIMRNAPNKKLFSYIENELKPHYKIGLLSNTGRNRLNELFKPEELSLFDALSLSYETGYLKPQPEAYRAAAEDLGVGTEECVFIDDQGRQCEGSRIVGMRAICYQDFEHLKYELEQLLAKP